MKMLAHLKTKVLLLIWKKSFGRLSSKSAANHWLMSQPMFCSSSLDQSVNKVSSFVSTLEHLVTKTTDKSLLKRNTTSGAMGFPAGNSGKREADFDFLCKEFWLELMKDGTQRLDQSASLLAEIIYVREEQSQTIIQWPLRRRMTNRE